MTQASALALDFTETSCLYSTTWERRVHQATAALAPETLRPLVTIFADEGSLFEQTVAEIYQVGARFVRLPDSTNHLHAYSAATYINPSPALFQILQKAKQENGSAVRLYAYDPMNPKGAEQPASDEDIAFLKHTLETQEWNALKAYKARGRQIH